MERRQESLRKAMESGRIVLNTIGMAELFAEVYRGVCRCAKDKWYVYQDGIWRNDENALTRLTIEFAKLLYAYRDHANQHGNGSGSLNRMVEAMQKNSARRSMLTDAASILEIDAEKFDSDPYLLNAKNCAIDLRNGTVRQHSAEFLMTMQTGAEFQDGVRCERFDRFVSEIFRGDEERIDALQRAIGCSITGRNREECMFIAYGKSSRNGKSTLLNAVCNTLGSYAGSTAAAFLCGNTSRDGERAQPELYRLSRKRFVTMSEPEVGDVLNSQKLKQYTGGEGLNVRDNFRSSEQFVPRFTMWMSCNSLPRITDMAVYRSKRVRVIPFERHFGSEEQDRGLKDYFEQEEAKAGILSWILDGYFRYAEQGLPEYDDGRRQECSLAEFIAEYEPDGKNQRTVYEEYEEWCCENDVDPLRMKGLRAELERSGYAVNTAHVWQKKRPRN